MVPFYRTIIKKALSISWKNKWLWIVGFFAAFITQGSVYEVFVKTMGDISNQQSLYQALRDYSETGIFGFVSWANIRAIWQGDFTALSMGLFLALLVACVFALIISLGIIGQGGLIKSFVSLDKGKKVTFKESLKTGVEKFWPILELNFITKVIMVGFVLILAYIVSILVAMTASISPWLYVLLLVVVCLILVVAVIIITFITLYGTAYIVLRDKNAFEALRSAWNLFRKNILVNIEMGFLLFIINILVVIGFTLVAFVALSPFIILYFIAFVAGVKILASVLAGIMFIGLLLLLVLIGSWYSTFQLGSWAVLFETLALEGGKPKLVRLVEHLIQKPSVKNKSVKK